MRSISKLVKCQVCDNLFKPKSVGVGLKTKHCSFLCSRVPLKGRTPWNKGLKAKDDIRILKFVEAGHKASKGHIPWNKGIKMSFEQKSKLNLSGLKKGWAWNKGTKGIMKGHNKGKKFPFKPRPKAIGRIPWNKGLTKNIDLRVMSISQKVRSHSLSIGRIPPSRRGIGGSLHPNWKGGIAPLCNQIRSLLKYKTWVKTIFRRDNYICQICNKRGNKLSADHIKPFSIIIRENKINTIKQALECSELWDTNNGRTLCHSCHKNTDTYAWKMANYLRQNKIASAYFK